MPHYIRQTIFNSPKMKKNMLRLSEKVEFKVLTKVVIRRKGVFSCDDGIHADVTWWVGVRNGKAGTVATSPYLPHNQLLFYTLTSIRLFNFFLFQGNIFTHKYTVLINM